MERAVLHTDADRYVIVEYLAEGGMGAIYLGKKIGMGGFEKEVVLKQLLPEFTSQAEFIDLFVREAKLSAALDHANIVHTIDFVAAGSDYFIVMEYVRGGDLRAILRRIKRRGRELSAAAALFVAREILAALGYAHEKKSNNGQHLKLIHRDVSPSNIMISAVGEVKLTDFGIAKASTHKSIFYRVKGKVGYMSPEQAYGDRPLDHRSDLYSLAIVLYEMLAGERLFVADLLSTPDQIYKQPIKLLEGVKDVPPGIDAVLQKALHKDADQRYQTAPDFLDAVAQVAYDTGQLFTATDLANHLRDICGDDPGRWNHEHDEEEEEADRPGTQVLSGEAEAFSGVQLTSVLSAEEIAADFAAVRSSSSEAASAVAARSAISIGLDDDDDDALRRSLAPHASLDGVRGGRSSSPPESVTRHIKVPGTRQREPSSEQQTRHIKLPSGEEDRDGYEDEPTRHLKVGAHGRPFSNAADSLPQFDVGDIDVYSSGGHQDEATRASFGPTPDATHDRVAVSVPSDAFDLDEDPTTIGPNAGGPNATMAWGQPEVEDEMTVAYADVSNPAQFARDTPARRDDPRARRDADSSYASYPGVETDPRMAQPSVRDAGRGAPAAAAPPPPPPPPQPQIKPPPPKPPPPVRRAPASPPIDRVATPAVSKPADAPTKQLDRGQSLSPSARRPASPVSLPRPSSARRAQLPAPSSARNQRTAQVDTRSPRRGRNAMLLAAGILMFAAIAIVVIVGLSGPEIHRGSGTGPGTTPGVAGSGSGGSGSAAAAGNSAKRAGATAGTADAGKKAARAVRQDSGAGGRQASAGKGSGSGSGGARRADGGAAAAAKRTKQGTSVTVESSPSRAAVFLDGVRQCRAKCTVEGLDPNHTYLLSVRRRKYIAWSQLLKLGKRRHVRIKAYLSETPDSRTVGYLVVRVTPVADVSVDGTRIGRVTSDGRIPLRPGQHEIMLTRGKRKLRFLVDIKRQRITETEKLILK